ncbi:ADM_collapsed_G0023450.mRNA.1.CDS.1 [Saccharomyces cerevisiae]|nr:ADM_collapsed_G0023450.mRNA.1.CDS.1 [Saccharomyces cerevisiae]
MRLPLKVPTPTLVLLPPKVPTPNTSATTTESTNARAKEDANKDGNAEDNRFPSSTTLTKSRIISGKGVKWFC